MDDNVFQAVVVVVFALLGEIGRYVSVGTAMAALARVVGGLICGVLLSDLFLIVLKFIHIAINKRASHSPPYSSSGGPVVVGSNQALRVVIW
jgi:hypothetical protein